MELNSVFVGYTGPSSHRSWCLLLILIFKAVVQRFRTCLSLPNGVSEEFIVVVLQGEFFAVFVQLGDLVAHIDLTAGLLLALQDLLLVL